MKKVIVCAALAVAVIGLTVSCKCSGNKVEEPVVEEVVVEEEPVVEEVVAEAPVEEVVAPAPKQEEPKVKVVADKQKGQLEVNTKNTETKANEDGSVSIKAGKTKVTINEGGNTTVSSDGKVKAVKR